MTRLHFDDLKAIKSPFGLLDDDTQQRLRAWPHGVEMLGVDDWYETRPPFLSHRTYRARPAPLVQDTVDWSHVAEPFNWHARDADGEGCFFAHKPCQGAICWVQTDGGWCRSASHASYVRGNTHWRDSLISRPGVKG